MSAELDLSQYLDLFLQEAEEQLEILEQETLKLEREPTPERLQTIFRAAHTLKGSSRAMGFASFAGLTHEMENILDQLRSNQRPVSSEVTDLLLECVDGLGKIQASIAEGQGEVGDYSDLLSRLQFFLQAPVEAVGTPAPSSTETTFALSPELEDALQAAQAQQAVWVANVRLSPECVMKFVRAFMVLNAISTSGEVLATIPEQAQLEDEQFEQEFQVYFQTSASVEELQAQFSSFSEIESITLRPYLAATPAPPEDEQAAPPQEAKSGPAPSANAPGRRQDSGQTVRVDVARLDTLMNLVGELVIDRTRVAQIGHELHAKFSDPALDALEETVSHITRITSDLQDQIMKARMLPIETVFNRFPRVVRDLAQKLGKSVELELLGGETELDRSVIEVIGDPLLHILRNSVDHGLELPSEREAAGKPAQGKVRVSARHEENHIVIEIMDDGRGIHAERVKAKALAQGLVSPEAAERLTEKEILQFIFASGLSTASELSEISGRGVGMDIVRSNIQRLGGLIDLETSLGQWTKFTLRLPLTLAIIRGLLVDVSGVVYVLPLSSVVETFMVSTSKIQTVNRREVIVVRGLTTPILRLGSVFGSAVASAESSSLYVVIVGLAEKRIGLVVDRLIGEQEVVIKSLSTFCGDVAGVSGATILGDGHVALIADVSGLIESEAA
ncbi:MAG TPA: chemotaxis protein CheA [Fimbriimonadaceae bacterium]|nr:chemotaxis protein CheA [Fimbriimonadaceae bacterium]HRJ31963.1 chemotaxis protein CheA [Fimbriimonadaceae bacterium]